MGNKKIQQLELNIKKKLNGDFFGLYKSAFKGQGIDFTELREYVFGDPIKNIDWNSSAKYGKLYTKLYEQEKDIKVLFVIDIGETMNFGTENKTKKETLEEIFFLLSMCVNNVNDRIGVLLFDENILSFLEFKKGEENIIKTIKIIEEYKKETPSNIFNAIKYIYKLNIKDSLIFILSDNLNYQKNDFQAIAINNEIIYINIFDYYENNLSKNLYIPIGNKSGWISGIINKSNNIDKFKKLREGKIKNLQKNLKKLHIDYILLDNKSDIFISLSKLFYIRLQH